MSEYEGGDNRQELQRQEKIKAWQDRLEEIEHTKDALGFPVDAKIRETIVALNVYGIPTSTSCEGHSDRAKGAPWIKIEAFGRPSERYVGESALIESVAKRFHVSAEDVRTARNYEAWKEAMALSAGNGETNEYQRWREQNKILRDKLHSLLEDFYRGRTVVQSTRLEIGQDPEGTARLHNGGSDYTKGFRDLTQDEREGLATRLLGYQEEMRAFTEDLKAKYYSSQWTGALV